MANNESVVVDSTSIRPLINGNESQIIFQRHCDYDRNNGGLIPESAQQQLSIATSFVDELKRNLSAEELKNIYFLFDSSNTVSSGDFKRCVETTNIAMGVIKRFFEENNVPADHIINLRDGSNYNGRVRENSNIIEPKMFTDSSGFFEYLEEKHGGINLDFWIDFEEDASKDIRQEFNSEGPDEIVERGVRYVNVLQRYAKYFHSSFPGSRLVIWCGTHYDLISPLVKLRVLGYDKSDSVMVNYCGGMSFLIDEANNMTVSVNGTNYPFDSQYNKQLHRHF